MMSFLTISSSSPKLTELVLHERQALGLQHGFYGEKPRPLADIAMKFGITADEAAGMIRSIEQKLAA
jgi:hypothetical protein